MTQDLIDTSVFEDLAEAMGDDFAAELLETFLGDAPNMFGALTQAISDGDADAFRRAAHSIKSNAQTFGATQLADEARALEVSGTIDPEAAQALSTTFEASATALKGLVDG